MNTENNILIAEFMGYKKMNPENVWYYNTAKNSELFVQDSKYDSSWDWLMPVVEKIEDLKENIHSLDVQMCVDRIAILVNASPLYVDIRQFSKKSKLESVYNAVIEFIKWYNENSAEKN